MSFLWPKMLFVLILVPALVAVYLWLQRRRQKYAVRYASLSLVKDALGHGPGFRRHVPPLLFLTALAVMIVALARPVSTVMLPSQQGTVILTIDCSGSMRADDLKPSRLEAAKEASREFVDKQPENVRVGVVSFSDGASLVQAPTKDHEAVLAAINRLSIQRRTAIGSGILTSLDAIFEDPSKPTATPTPTSSRDYYLGQRPTATPTPTYTPVAPGTYTAAVVVLLSDGVSNTGPRPLDAAKQASDRGVRVYTVGVGSPGGAVLRMEGFAMRVQLDEETLKTVAERTGGAYFKADNSADLNKIYRELSMNLVFKAEQTELTAWFTAIAALVSVIAGVLSLMWFNRLL